MSSPAPQSPHEKLGMSFWWLREGEQIRGPYTGKQMLSLLMKGTISPRSEVRPDTETEWREAGKDPEFAKYFTAPGAGGAAGAAEAKRMPNFVILVDEDAYSSDRVEAVIGEMGPHLRLMPNIWFLQSSLQVEKIRNYLVRQLSDIERLFIFDVNRNTYSAHKFEEGLEGKIAELLTMPEGGEE